MTDITCVRCGETRSPLAAPPLPNELGQRILSSICQVCWKDWLRQQTSIINHYGLDLRDPKARQMLTQQTEAFLFGAAKS
ncbi:MAG: oxidative damage protection protein [Gemmatimonadetes bacterium]|nr:oxidative damage protection protein [Gemmatimonadota bacterium]